MAFLSVQGISHSFGERPVLRDVSFEVEGGEVVALIGPNGAGKSTLLSMVAGDSVPDRGQVLVGGSPLTSYRAVELARQRAMLLQKTAVAFSYTVQEVVEMGRTPWRGTPKAARDEALVKLAMEQTETVHMAQRDITTLSGGEAGRAHLARIFAQDTPLLLLDEPTAALDILHQEQTLKNARAYAQAGAAVLVVLHDLDVAAAYADRIVLLEAGAVVAAGSPAEVCTAERLSAVYGHEIEVLTHPTNGRLLILPKR